MVTIKRILCPVDFSSSSTMVAEYAKALARRFDARIIALYVAPTMNRYALFQVPTQAIETFVGAIVSGAREKMEEFVPKVFGDVDAMGLVDTGDPAEGILRAVKTEEADMVVMGTHGRKGIDRIMFGSVAERVVKESPAPVLTIRP